MRFPALLLILSLFLSIQSPALASDADSLVKFLIIGTWEEGTVPYGTVTFDKDGTYRAELYETSLKENMLLEISGTWEVKGGELRSVLQAASSTDAPVGESFVDEIVQINQNEMILVGIDGKKYSKFRVKTKKETLSDWKRRRHVQ